MPNESDLHKLLASFGPAIIAFLTSIGFFDIDGPYDAQELLASAPARVKREYAKSSQEKNSKVWQTVSSLFLFDSILSGVKQTAKEYPAPIQRSIARKIASGIPQKTVEAVMRKSAQDYMNEYVKSESGKFITNMGRTDQKKLVDFIWSNAGEHERPLAKMINKQPHLRYVLDQGNHRVETIVRTEKARATRYGALKFAKDNDFKTKTWHSAGDKRVRPSHGSLSGKTIPIKDDFPGEGQYPGSVSINCRCFLTYGM